MPPALSLVGAMLLFELQTQVTSAILLHNK